jgi:hypothetical protein
MSLPPGMTIAKNSRPGNQEFGTAGARPLPARGEWSASSSPGWRSAAGLGDDRVIEVGRSPCTPRGRLWNGSSQQPVEIVAALLFDELDCKAVGQKPDDAADAGPDGKGRSNLRLHFRGDRDTGG